MVRWILRGIAALALLAFLFVASVADYVWHLGSEAMGRAKASGWFEVERDAPLSVFESTVQRAYFSKGWNERAFACGVPSQLWAVLANNWQPNRHVGVSTPLANAIMREKRERSIKNSVQTASLSCHLEG